MAEMASVASDGGGKRGLPPQFASNLNDMGPPLSAGPLCSALLLAANAACRPSSASLRSFDSNDDKSAVSDVVAHVDTVRFLDRSFLFIPRPILLSLRAPFRFFYRMIAVIDQWLSPKLVPFIVKMI